MVSCTPGEGRWSGREQKSWVCEKDDVLVELLVRAALRVQ